LGEVTQTLPVVVPLDGSAVAERAVPAASQLAGAYDAPLEFVHVLETGGREHAGTAGASQRFRDYVSDLLARYGVTRDGAAEVVEGSPAPAIVDRSSGALAVALATGGRGGAGGQVIGGVADKVIRGASAPVLAVPPAARQQMAHDAVVVGLDGSRIAEAGLHLARDLGQRLRAKVILVRAWELQGPGGMRFTPVAPAESSSAARMEAEQYIADVQLPGEEGVCIGGRPAEVLAMVAERVAAAMVVLTTQGRGSAGQRAFGSTTDRALHLLSVPLFVVPPAPLRPRAGAWDGEA
jgi:nucleotide-binding universal stress UspA family protein